LIRYHPIDPQRWSAGQRRAAFTAHEHAAGRGLRQRIEQCSTVPARIQQEATILEAGDFEREPPAPREIGPVTS